MFGSAILEVAIGLIFVFLLVSLIVTAANELIASALKWRAANLEKGIRNLLDDPNAQRLAKDFFAHPLIQGLAEAGKRPSYIPSRSFALALLDIVAPNANGEPQKITDIRNVLNNASIPDNVKKALLVLLADAGNDLRRFQESVEIWFNNAMDRVAGWYRRKAQAMLLILAVAFTAVLNIDTIAIVRALSVDPELRAALVERATATVQQPPAGQTVAAPTSGTAAPDDATKEQLVERITTLEETGIPFGWKATDLPDSTAGVLGWAGWSILKILGLAFTALAVSLGAPFWFDILNKIISIRSTGKAPEEAPKPPREVPTPLEPGQTPSQADALRSTVTVAPGGAAAGAQPAVTQPAPGRQTPD